MFQTNLPNNAKATSEENSSTYCPSGMLDRDQRTAFPIEKSKMNKIPLIPQLNYKNTIHQPSSSVTVSVSVLSSHHCHQNNSDDDGTITTRCTNISKTKDNIIEPVMSGVKTKKFPKYNFNRSRTKFSVTFQIITWIILITHNSTLISSAPAGCSYVNPKLSETIEKQIITSRDYIGELIQNYNKLLNLPEDFPSTWRHQIQKYDSHDAIRSFFTHSDPMHGIQEALQNITDRYSDEIDHLNYSICVHAVSSLLGQIKEEANLTDRQHASVLYYLTETRKYVSLNIVHIEDGANALKLKLKPRREEKTCQEYAKDTIKKAVRFFNPITIHQVIQINFDMLAVLKHIRTKICP